MPRPRRRFIRADYSRALGFVGRIHRHNVKLTRRQKFAHIPEIFVIYLKTAAERIYPGSLVHLFASLLAYFNRGNRFAHILFEPQQRDYSASAAHVAAAVRFLHCREVGEQKRVGSESMFLRNDCGYARAEVFELEFVHQMSLFGFSFDILIDLVKNFLPLSR